MTGRPSAQGGRDESLVGNPTIRDQTTLSQGPDVDLLQRQRASAALLDFLLALVLAAAVWFGSEAFGLTWELGA